jgi:RsiW-degrading membrane proteinase PrsW (M82 family)
MSDERSRRRTATFRWTVIEGDRLVVAGALLGGILLVLLALLAVGLFPRAPGEPLYLLISAFLGGNLTLITVVIAINQLVFSRELGSPGDLEQRTRNAVEYREQVQAVLDQDVSPVLPGSFLLVLHENLGKRAQSLRETVTGSNDDELGAEIDELAGALRRDVRDVTRALDAPAADEQIFGAIAATLGTTQAEQLYDLSRIETAYEARLSDEQRALFESIREHLLHIDVARKYFRTVYITKELSFLSRVLLLAGLPAQLFLAATLAVYDLAAIEALPAAAIVGATLVAMVACFAPLAILASFVLRLSWVAQRNATVMPFAASEKDYTLFSSGE